MAWQKRTKASQWVITALEPAGGWPCFTLTVSDIPPGSNDRLHHMTRHKVYTAYSNLVAWHVRQWLLAGGHAFRLAHVEFTLMRKGGRAMDDDGATSRLKPLLDGLVRGGLMTDDSGKYCEAVLPPLQVTGARRCCVMKAWEVGA